jgi:serine/threonine protein kinase HipA of HipAB toxin-antitoxin module
MRMRAIDEEATSPGAGSMADVLRQNQEAQTAGHQAITSVADIGGRGRGGFVKQNFTPAAGSINQIINRPKTSPAGGLRRGSRPGGLPPRLEF